MAQITVSINGRQYPVACDDGQEQRIRSLAEYIDGKVGEFAGKLGQIGEARLLLLAGLVLADELAEATDALRRQRRSAAATTSSYGASADGVLASGIESLAERIDAIAARLEKTNL